MRKTFLATLVAEAANDPNIWLLNGDLGYSVLEPFREKFPERYVNMGIAEQNMIGVAAGLALSGRKVFVYSIINFATLRCLEQIRNDVCYHNADVKVVGVGSGLSYGPQGYTHYAVEDIAVMRALPRMTVYCPGDPVETRWATQHMTSNKGPAYLRLPKAGEPTLHQEPLDHNFVVGKSMRLRDGKDVTLITTGNMLESAVKVAELLASDGVDAGVISMPTMKPLDENFVHEEAARVPLLVTLEEHARCGGLSEAVGTALATSPLNIRARVLGCYIPEEICSGLVGDQLAVRRMLNLAPDQIALRIKNSISLTSKKLRV